VPLGSGSRPRLGFSATNAIAALQAAPKAPVAPPLPLRTGVRRRRRSIDTSLTVQELLNGPRVVVGARAKAGGRG
jgi:hypothetical protein